MRKIMRAVAMSAKNLVYTQTTLSIHITCGSLIILQKL